MEDNSFISQLDNCLNTFETVQLDQFPPGFLMDRSETKFLLNQINLFELLTAFHDWKILKIENMIQEYETTYFDDQLLTSYYDHYRGKANRFKVRKRFYQSTGTSFFEVKRKNNKGLTTKNRLLIDKNDSITAEKTLCFLTDSSLTIVPNDLKEQLHNRFSRIVLVDGSLSKKMTVDFNLSFQKEEESKEIKDCAIIELKYLSYPTSDIKKIINLGGIESSFSKYCIGTALLNKDVKINAFKPILIKINQWNF